MADGTSDTARREATERRAAAARRALAEAEARRALAEAEARRQAEAAGRPPVEVGGRGGPEPVRYGDWDVKGRAVDF